MGEVDVILDEFNGQLSYSEILHMTKKELTYLREHRQFINELRAKQAANLGNPNNLLRRNRRKS